MILAVTALVVTAAVILGDVAHSVVTQNARERQWLAKTATKQVRPAVAAAQAAAARTATSRTVAVAEQHAA